MRSELERWWERQLDEYQRAQIIDRLDRQRLLDEYNHARAIDRLDKHNADLSLLASILADASASVSLIEADIARLLAVTDRYLPVVVDHLALVGTRLTEIGQMIASPRETEAFEAFRSGTRSLMSAIAMSETGSRGLSDDWLDEAISDLSQAVKTYKHKPEFWFQLGVAHARRGPSRDAADAFSRCARYAVSESPGFAAEAVLLAAAQLRTIGEQDTAKDLLHKFLPALERCAEIHFNLAVHHGESDLLRRAFELAPVLAIASRAEGVASAEVEAAAADVCRYRNGPVSRLRSLENAIRVLTEAARELPLDFDSQSFDPVSLPEFGVDALLLAHVRNHLVADRGASIARDIIEGLDKAEAEVQKCFQRLHDAKVSGDRAIKIIQERGAQGKKRAQRLVNEEFDIPLTKATKKRDGAERACELAERSYQRMVAAAARARERVAAYKRFYDRDGRLLPDVQSRLRKVFDEPLLRADKSLLLYWHRSKYRKYENPAFKRDKDVRDWAIRYSGLSIYDINQTPYDELELYRIGKLGAEIRADSKRAERSAEDAATRVQDARKALQLCTDRLEQAKRQKTEGDEEKILREAEVKADSDYRRVVQQVEGAIRSAELEYNLACNASRRAAEVMTGFLQRLEIAIEAATASQGRIIPSALIGAQ
jgi:hypothetical protein